VVRDVQAFNGAASASNINLDLYVSGSFNSEIVRFNSLAALSTAPWSGRVVLDVGDELAIAASQAGTTLVISGYLLS
jgi:hypothetical protein